MARNYNQVSRNSQSEAQQMDWSPATLLQSEVRGSNLSRPSHPGGTSYGLHGKVSDPPLRNVLPKNQQTFGGIDEYKNVRFGPKTFLRNIRISSTIVVNRPAYQRGQSTQMTYQDLQWSLYNRYEYNFHPVVCGLILHLIHPTSQDVADQTISFEEYTKFLPLLDQWVAYFRKFAIFMNDKEYIEGKTVKFTIACQKGFLLFTRLKQALMSAGYKVADDFAKIAFEKFKEKDQGAVSLNSFIAICLLLERSSVHISRTEMTFLDLQWCLNSRYKFTFDPIVCSLMIHLIHLKSQNVAKQTISLEEYKKLLPILHIWIAKFREFAFVKKDDGERVEGVSLDFTTAIQHGILNFDRLNEAFWSMGVNMADNIAEKFKEKKKEAVSLNSFISICLRYTAHRAK
ncbi:Hypothetical predicted protein [Cloeon dipterum]|uniref:EF-hand domain-containing protein n=1 Tax=Cloeon dipterum TaxID=197152 RepID=A0A8S1BNN6_9INSE|nr:Hypothetical predicted protein [Cloeon dipterum]